MSVKIMGMVWDLDNAIIEREEKYILLAYADHADHKGYNIFPAIETISDKTGYKERSTQLITRSLEEKGFLVEDGRGPKGTNKWRIPLDREGVKIAPVQKTAPGGAKPTVQGGAPANAPESSVTVLEPSEEEERNPLKKFDDPQFGQVVTDWNNLHTFLIPTHANLLGCMLDEWRGHAALLPDGHPDRLIDPVAVLKEAMVITGKNARNPHSLAYMQQILNNWMQNGYGHNPHAKKFEKRGGKKQDLLQPAESPEDLARRRAEADRIFAGGA